MNLPEAQAQLAKLEAYHRLYTNPDFQMWVGDVNKTTDALEIGLKESSFESEEMQGHLKMLALNQPKSVEDELRVYIGMKAVLAFWSRKLGLLKTQSSNYDKTKRKVIELGRQDGIGTNRSAGNR